MKIPLARGQQPPFAGLGVVVVMAETLLPGEVCQRRQPKTSRDEPDPPLPCAVAGLYGFTAGRGLVLRRISSSVVSF